MSIFFYQLYILYLCFVHFCLSCLYEVTKMCYVTATELKNNLSQYLQKAMEEDVYVTKNNKVICVLVSPQLKALYEAERLIRDLDIPEEAKKKSYKELVGEAIEEKCDY